MTSSFPIRRNYIWLPSPPHHLLRSTIFISSKSVPIKSLSFFWWKRKKKNKEELSFIIFIIIFQTWNVPNDLKSLTAVHSLNSDKIFLFIVSKLPLLDKSLSLNKEIPCWPKSRREAPLDYGNDCADFSLANINWNVWHSPTWKLYNLC